MTPKEKANELIEKFKKATTYKYQEYAGANYSTFEHDIEELKNCAIIAVDEIIYQIDNIDTYLGNLGEHLYWWQEVKSELENLKNL